MKFKALLSIALVAMLAAFTASATPTLVVGTLVTVNNTSSNSAPFTALNYVTSSQQIAVTHGALTATNAFSIGAQFTFDQTNYIASPLLWYPSYTNATTEYIQPGYFTFSPYMRTVCTSTNSIQYSETYGQ